MAELSDGEIMSAIAQQVAALARSDVLTDDERAQLLGALEGKDPDFKQFTLSSGKPGASSVDGREGSKAGSRGTVAFRQPRGPHGSAKAVSIGCAIAGSSPTERLGGPAYMDPPCLHRDRKLVQKHGERFGAEWPLAE